MKSLIKEIENVNLILYDTLHKGRDFYGEEWSDSSIYKAGLTYARVCFLMFSARCRKYLDFAKFDFYWDNLWKELQLKEVESAGYVNRMQKYFEKFSSKILKADYDKLIKSVFIRDLLNDGYISQEEAEEYCRLLANVHDKALRDAIRLYKIILSITDPKDEKIKSNTPTFDFLCKNIDSRLKEKFINFCLTRLHNNIELDDTNKVLLLKKIVGNNIKERLKANKLQMKGLWLELKRLNIISEGVSYDTLNKAIRNVSEVKPEILNDWDNYL